jgi:hypothetical protein
VPVHELLNEGREALVDSVGSPSGRRARTVGDRGPATRWPERSIAIGNGVSVASATARDASAQSAQVASAPGISMPACSKSVAFTKAPVMVSWLCMP